MTTGEEQQPVAVPADATPPQGVQEEMPFALVHGLPLTAMPKDLYIPPDALQVFLESFEGPLDLLLYLIRRQNLDILDIPMLEITRQYMDYVEMVKAFNLELAADYLVMAAVLAEIKSRMLLPRPPSEDGEEEDPRAELVRRLQEYERFKKAAEDMDAMPRIGRDVWVASTDLPNLDLVKPVPDVELKEILLALRDVMKRVELTQSHFVAMEPLSVRERMSAILEKLSQVHFTDFPALFTPAEGRMGVVVTFLAIMELSRESLVEIIQSELFGPIHVRAKIQ
ncbi:segregation/condensation protein A [Permianibacter sp. IMCC34836]|uniref:segregation and condensation protein A n=1 Tax=Permianibacter fluminis TaxID=2738515 RepID=UPI0015550EE9|nr:segregation/condensation protein A [Permianibacter fluminis]